jgi:type I restriction-modification system DNA methylase subunit
MSNAGQQYLNGLDKRLWSSSDRLRANVNPVDYTPEVLGLVFLKYIFSGFCKAATLAEIRKREYVLTAGHCVGAAAQEEGSEPFGGTMARLTFILGQQFAESVRKNLAGLSYEV